jgi:chemotaxis signal transduction protein
MEQFLTVSVGHRRFALPLDEVRHIVTLRPEFRCSGANAEEYLAFEGTPLPFVSSWDHLGEPSLYEEFAELNAMLPQRRQDHIDWMSGLENSIRQGHAFSKARSPFDCAFGKWYYAYRPANRQLALLLTSFEQPHARIHALADQLLGLVDTGGQQEALARFQRASETVLKELLNLFEEAQRLTVSLQRRVAILLRDSDAVCALGVDSVNDIAALTPDRVTKPGRVGTSSAPPPTLLMLEDQTLVPLIEWQTFLSNSPPARRQ